MRSLTHYRDSMINRKVDILEVSCPSWTISAKQLHTKLITTMTAYARNNIRNRIAKYIFTKK